MAVSSVTILKLKPVVPCAASTNGGRRSVGSLCFAGFLQCLSGKLGSGSLIHNLLERFELRWQCVTVPLSAPQDGKSALGAAFADISSFALQSLDDWLDFDAIVPKVPKRKADTSSSKQPGITPCSCCVERRRPAPPKAVVPDDLWCDRHEPCKAVSSRVSHVSCHSNICVEVSDKGRRTTSLYTRKR